MLFLAQAGVPEEIKPRSPFEDVQISKENPAGLPDIYYIVLDAYGRSDVVQDLFGYDNTEFIAFLEANGFYVAKKSRSNYLQTALSLSSALNLNYLGELEDVNIRSEDREPLAELIQHSELRNFLEEQGYPTVAFATGYGPTKLVDAESFILYLLNYQRSRK